MVNCKTLKNFLKNPGKCFRQMKASAAKKKKGSKKKSSPDTKKIDKKNYDSGDAIAQAYYLKNNNLTDLSALLTNPSTKKEVNTIFKGAAFRSDLLGLMGLKSHKVDVPKGEGFVVGKEGYELKNNPQ